MRIDTPVHSSLRRSLRRIPAFRSLPADRLVTLASRITHRYYQPGEILWHSGDRTDFLGIVEHGELLIERRIRGAMIHSMRLKSGDLLSPEKLSGQNSHAFVLARAVTNVEIRILPTNRSEEMRQATGRLARPESMRPHSLVNWAWVLITAILLMIFSSKDIARVSSSFLYMLAEPGALTQNVEQRMKLLHYAEAVDRSSTFAHNEEGYILFQEANLREAARAFTAAIARNPLDSSALNNLAVVSFLTGRYPLALELVESAVQNAPDDPVLRYNLGLVLVASNRKTEALQEFSQATYIDPSWALPHLQRAYIYLQQLDYIRAEDEARQAIQLDGLLENAHLIRAVALYNQGKYPDALDAVENTLRLDPDNRIAQFYNAMILSELQQFDPALAILHELLTSTQDPAEIARITTEIEAVLHFQHEFMLGS